MRLSGRFLPCLCLAAVFFFAATAGYSQVSPDIGKYGYAESIYVNGKVVSMDDASTSTSPGHVYQALAVKGDKIVKLGTTDEVKAMAGPDTKSYDLKGRLLLPGIVEPHSHIYGGANRFLDRFGFKFPPNGIIVERTADRDLEKTQGIMRDAIKDAVKKVKPGDWVVLQMQGNPGAPNEVQFWGMTRRLTNRKTLDLWAPDNPVLMRPGLRGTINSKALQILNEYLPGYSASIQETMHGVDIGEDIAGIGWVGSQEMAVIEWELFLSKLPNNVLAQALKLASEDFAALGVTAFGTRIPFPKVMSGYSTLVGLGQMPIRLDAHYEVHRMPTDPQQTRQMYRRTGVIQGIGDDYLWIDGVASERWDSYYPESCTGPDTKAPPTIKARETCPHPGDLHWDTLENAMKAGWRLSGVHICGSESLRSFVKMIDRAREVNGWSMQDVRDMHMTGEHCGVIGKLPDVIQKIKDYGLILSCGPDIISEAPNWNKDYGPEMEKSFVLPFNTWIKSGVQLVGQHYGSGTRNQGKPNFRPPFFMLWQAVSRKFDNKVWSPDEKIDRVWAMKMYTRWAANYLRKPDKIGSLEVGKYADLLVIDRDYFTIPEDEILKVRPLMTVVGGKTIVLQEALAKDLGIPAVGPKYTFKDEDLQWVGASLEEIAKKFGNVNMGVAE